MGEFDIIERYFRAAKSAASIDVGIGDDCAVIDVPNDQQLIVTTDSLVEGVHFPIDSEPRKLAYRTCATAISDIAAMGGTANWASLALTVPKFDEAWFSEFVHGFEQALSVDNTRLIGGDLTKGPLVVTWHIMGTVPSGTALLRSGSVIGDDIFVTGELGGAAHALSLLTSDDISGPLLDAYWFPTPRLKVGRALGPYASACIDISDGLLGDLNHILRASATSAVIDLASIPIAPALRNLTHEKCLALALNGGDDYELCFTAAKKYHAEINAISENCAVPITRIGEIVAAQQPTSITTTDGETLSPTSFQHF